MNLNFLNAFLAQSKNLTYADRLAIVEEKDPGVVSVNNLSDYLKQNHCNSSLLTDLQLIDNIDRQIAKLQNVKSDFNSIIEYMQNFDSTDYDLSVLKIDNESGIYTPLKFQIMRVNKNYYKIVRR